MALDETGEAGVETAELDAIACTHFGGVNIRFLYRPQFNTLRLWA